MVINEALTERTKETFKSLRSLGIIMSVLMIIMGAVLFIIPTLAAAIAVWSMVLGILFYGILDIVVYFKLPKESRDGNDLGMGIIWIVIGLFLTYGCLFASDAAQLVAWGTFEYTIAFMVSFSCIFSGIKAFTFCSTAKSMGQSTAGFIFGGILNIIAGIIILTYPIGSAITLTVFYGLFLLICGISLLCRVLSCK